MRGAIAAAGSLSARRAGSVRRCRRGCLCGSERVRGCVCLCQCVSARVRACVCARACAIVRASARVRVRVFVRLPAAPSAPPTRSSGCRSALPPPSLRAATSSAPPATQSRGAARSQTGTPHSMVSRTARYPARHGIPHGTVSRTAWYLARHGIPHGTVSRSTGAAGGARPDPDACTRARPRRGADAAPTRRRNRPAPTQRWRARRRAPARATRTRPCRSGGELRPSAAEADGRGRPHARTHARTLTPRPAAWRGAERVDGPA